jgi:FKBP-type peptidyl-prolyl cis-trans isomerase FkpA
VKVEAIVEGNGESPTRDDVVLINYKGMLTSGKVFDEGKQVPLAVDGVVPGFTQALEQMQRGGKYKVTIPSSLGYGSEANGPIPANSDLTFEVELLDFKSKAEIEEQQRIMQQLQQMQGGAPGAPGQMPPGAMPPGAVPPAPPQP